MCKAEYRAVLIFVLLFVCLPCRAEVTEGAGAPSSEEALPSGNDSPVVNIGA